MSKPIPAIQSAYLNLGEAHKWIGYAREDFEENDLGNCLDYINWSLDALNAAKAKIENHRKNKNT